MARRRNATTDTETDTETEHTMTENITTDAGEPGEDNEEALEQLANEAVRARDALTSQYEVAAPEMRRRWLAYGQLLAKIRERIPSRPDFGAFIASHELDKIGGVQTEKGVRGAAMKFAMLTDQERDWLADRFPAVYNPRTIIAKHKEMCLAAFVAVNEALEDGAEFELPKKLPTNNEERDQKAAEIVENFTSYLKDTNNKEIAGFIAAVPPVRFVTELKKFDYEKHKAGRKSTKFADLTVEAAADKITKMLEEHPFGEDVLKVVNSKMSKDDEMEDDDFEDDDYDDDEDED